MMSEWKLSEEDLIRLKNWAKKECDDKGQSQHYQEHIGYIAARRIEEIDNLLAIEVPDFQERVKQEMFCLGRPSEQWVLGESDAIKLAKEADEIIAKLNSALQKSETPPKSFKRIIQRILLVCESVWRQK